MKKDLLFLLKPNFTDPAAGPHPFFCPPCAQIQGFLGYYPAIRETLEIVAVDFPRPRPAVIAHIGEANQGCPVLILAEDATIPAACADKVKRANGKRFIYGAADITTYLGLRHGAGVPH
jgi:hypothetical protein